MPLSPAHDVPLAPFTTLQLGGHARFFIEARTEDELRAAIAWADERALPLLVVGGGSNLIVADAGYPGLVVHMGLRGIEERGIEEREAPEGGDEVWVTAAAGEPWDAFVAHTVQRELAGLECLSGIPGQLGATPAQNVGAYGRDVGESVVRVEAIDRRTGQLEVLSPARCAFGYRTSALKREPDRWIVTRVTFALRRGGRPVIAYAELARALAARPDASLSDVRDAVLQLRRKKSMVLDPSDPNTRSAGSFFTNPIVPAEHAAEVVRRAIQAGIVSSEAEVPRWPDASGRVKLAAGWLIERSGVTRGLRRGPVGVSSAHALALVHHGGGTTRELLALADEIRAKVRDTFDVELEREPVLVGPSS